MEKQHSVGSETVEGTFTTLWGDTYYCIDGVDSLKPFFISLASSSDHWLFLSSRGGVSAGRQNADKALFPYVNVDQIHHGSGGSGTKTYLHCDIENKRLLWEPFSSSPLSPYRIERRIYKNISGTSVVFEEQNCDLGLSFQYGWTTCEKFGFVKDARLLNKNGVPVRIRLLDGLFNILPAGISEQLFLAYSSLTDAYKLGEVDPGTGLGIFSLTSQIHDRPSPKENLLSTVVWHCGLRSSQVILHEDDIAAFWRGEAPKGKYRAEGTRCQYAIYAAFDLAPSAESHWLFVADVAQDQEQVAALRTQLAHGKHLIEGVDREVKQSRRLLDQMVSAGDGLQLSADKKSCLHHRTNVLFNVLRGGIFVAGYQINLGDFENFLSVRNRSMLEKFKSFLFLQKSSLSLTEFLQNCAEQNDPNMKRLALEYLPLCYSRRHGDPSRPWNKFEINIHNASGDLRYAYEGNWRDIFQNWEALGRAYPLFVKSFIAKFVNASTVDGYNPYRINRTGIEWERPEPDKVWSNIGYWGDHQVIYLLKLLEMYRAHFPGELPQLLKEDIFSYARVPYRLASFEQTVNDPRDTVSFEEEEERAILELEKKIGSDARLLADDQGNVYHVCLFEKLLLLVLTKLVNFVPGGGIWMNTQRPEWNDANNALAGYGLSMVTTCHLRQFIDLLNNILSENPEDGFSVSKEVAELFVAVSEIFQNYSQKAANEGKSAARNWAVYQLGRAGAHYRHTVYRAGFGAKIHLTTLEVQEFLSRSLDMVDRTIWDNKRKDGLYHSYNILDITQNGDNFSFNISRLQEMLEGQVAVLSSGLLNAAETIALLDALQQSRLYDPARKSYLLYPDKRLPGFLEKNRIPVNRMNNLALLSRWHQEKTKDQIVYRDGEGVFRFRAALVDASTLEEHLNRLEKRIDLTEMVRQERDQILALYEEVFCHRSYTGRSGSMFAYEGLGSIYWHMVSKLLYEIQESFFRAVDAGESAEEVVALREAYYRVREGLGYRKSAREFGAFPTDPYSHTPKSGEARQPGMTGQTKEGILIRLGELGIRINQGKVSFLTQLFEREEYLKENQNFNYFDLQGRAKEKTLASDSLVFLLYGVPIIYKKSTQSAVTVHLSDGAQIQRTKQEIDAPISRELFLRTGWIERIEVDVPSQLDLTKKEHQA